MSSTLTFFRAAVALLLAVLLASPHVVRAQQPDQTPPPTVTGSLLSATLKIFVLEGADAINSIPNRTVTVPVVEVRDENDIPVEGAEVVFELPRSGPGGSFPSQLSTFTTRTNVQGQARAPFMINTTPGTFDIKVTATADNRTGQTTITQTNTMRLSEEIVARRSPWYKNWKLLAIAGGAATAAAIILATRSGSASTSAPPTITITPGTPTFGGPR